jgi:hypothetical protein
LRLAREEPEAGSWCVEPLAGVIEALIGRGPGRAVSGRPVVAGRAVVLAVDGAATRGRRRWRRGIREAVPGSAVVHTDDVAWEHSRFGGAVRREGGRTAGLGPGGARGPIDGANLSADGPPPDDAGWMTEEIPFNTAQRTWERADLIVCGTPGDPVRPGHRDRRGGTAAATIDEAATPTVARLGVCEQTPECRREHRRPPAR